MVELNENIVKNEEKPMETESAPKIFTIESILLLRKLLNYIYYVIFIILQIIH